MMPPEVSPSGVSPLRVALATIGRFHSFDLARELQHHDALAAIYTGYPRRNFRDSGVDARLIRPFPWLQTPLVLAQRWHMVPDGIYRHLNWRSLEALDRFVARNLVPCDVLSALSGTGLASGREMQRRGGVYVCDRGSTHIAFQDRILSEEFARLGLSFAGVEPRIKDREISEYEQADAITVPSGFALQSFTDMGVAADKLHRIPYGVDISAFRATTVRDDEFRVLFVGALGVRKGLHDLLQGFAQAELPNARLVLAGPAEPEADRLLARFPVAALERTGPLPRAAVAEQMSRASVLVLPSVEEGLALVMAQALACALPVIATRNTGAEDLFADGDEGFIIDIRDPEAIAERLTRLAGDRALLDAMSDAARRRLEALGGWAAYGDASLALFRRLADERA